MKAFSVFEPCNNMTKDLYLLLQEQQGVSYFRHVIIQNYLSSNQYHPDFDKKKHPLESMSL